ncbi:cytochrome P450 2J4-like [Varanus komodoensis]|uniref:cytochrome P450 2J4-like n=1 Tax=Varanus komodoensis TaxID=61221 RepID=UPI001CF7ACAB|nr:cytochrome P450 2J4-like [Varanus komodoensis]
MTEIRVFLIVILLVLLGLCFLKQQWSRRHYPPGPLSLPVIGSIWRMGFRVSDNILLQLAEQYGNIYTIWLGNLPLVVLSGFQTVKEGLINNSEDFADRPTTPFTKALAAGRGIVLSNGHTWKQQRRFGLLTMRKLGLGKKGMELQIEEAARQLIENFASMKGQPLEPSFPITNLISNVICALTFGHSFSLEDKSFQKLVEAIHDSLKVATSFSYLLYEMFPGIMKHLPGPHQKAFSAIQVVLSYAKEEIGKHREHESFHEPQDFIDYYLLQLEKKGNKKDPTSTYDCENLAQCINDLFIAGTDTAATTLLWALLFLTNHPDVQEKVYKEMEDVFGPSCSIAYQDKKKLPYTNAVIHEIQRREYVLVFGLPRQTLNDVTVNGVLIPKGTMIFADMRSALLDPEQWETPHEFNPNHFLDKDGNFVAQEAFLAFGAGARTCLGEQLARMEVFIVLTSLVRAFQFQLPEGVKELDSTAVSGLTRHPCPFKICAVPRCSSP